MVIPRGCCFFFQDFSVTLYLRMFWQDTRLSFEGNRTLSLGSKGMEKIWLPDIYFLYEKNARVHTVTQPNRLMRIQPSGQLSFSERCVLAYWGTPFFLSEKMYVRLLRERITSSAM